VDLGKAEREDRDPRRRDGLVGRVGLVGLAVGEEHHGAAVDALHRVELALGLCEGLVVVGAAQRLERASHRSSAGSRDPAFSSAGPKIDSAWSEKRETAATAASGS
jgi:hypothetical protein